MASRISFKRWSLTFGSLSLELYLPTAAPIFVNSLERIDLPSSDAFFQEDEVHVQAIFSPPFSSNSVHREIRMAHDNQCAGGVSITLRSTISVPRFAEISAPLRRISATNRQQPRSARGLGTCSQIVSNARQFVCPGGEREASVCE